MKNRINWIDWIKAIAIYGVVLIHVHITETIREALLLWVNGLFFLISGYLFKRLPFIDELKKSIQSIFFPLLIYVIGISILFILKNGINTDFFYNLSILRFTNLVAIFAPICPLWFLISLFLMRVLTASSKFTPPILILLNILVLNFLNNPKEYNILMFTTMLLCYPYFYLGMILKKYDIITKLCLKIERLYSWMRYLIIPILFTLIVVGLKNGNTDMVQYNYGNNAFVFYGVSFSCCILIILFCRFFLNIHNNTVIKISSGTLLVLAIHFPVLSIIRNFISTDTFLNRLLVSIIIMIICYIGIVIAGKYCKILLGKSKFLIQ